MCESIASDLRDSSGFVVQRNRKVVEGQLRHKNILYKWLRSAEQARSNKERGQTP